MHQGILERIENLLNAYFQTDKPQSIGLPSVAYCAGELNLSANYFGDLIRKETGKTAQEYLQSKVIEVAKERIFDQNKSVSQIAYELGVKYPQHFIRVFKQRVGQSPNEYRRVADADAELGQPFGPKFNIRMDSKSRTIFAGKSRFN